MLAATLLVAPAPANAQTASIVLNGASPGHTFAGVGGVSAGGSSRLLIDYPEPERSQILDYLFRPDYGASLQLLKVEIGGDTDATDGPEPSIERTRGHIDCNRGYEWWLMAQAKARNPQIKFYALEWGAPGWFAGGRWSADNVNYIVDWLACAKAHGFHIDYLAGANESGYDKAFYEQLHQAVRDAGYDAQIVASDDHNPPNYWAVASDMAADPAFNASVDALGEHDICVWRSLYQHCNVSADALSLGKPLFNSETSTQAFDVGPGPLARAMNRDYIDARVTGNLDWALLSGWYADFPIAGTGLLEADQPWSGHYDLGAGIWVDAHTTQFAQPGWRYLDDSSGYLDNGASYVTLRSQDTDDYATVFETMDATAAVTVTLSAAGGLSSGLVHEWSTDLGTATLGDDFVHTADITPVDGSYSVTLQPQHVYTFSTVAGAHKGTASSSAGPGNQLPLPYSQDFENVGSTHLARYFSDNNGAFEAVPCGGGRDGTCYQQQITQAPIAWHGAAQRPATLVGDPSWWGDYQVSADAMLDQPGSLQLIGRAESQQHRVASYRLQFADTGAWQLYTEDVAGQDTLLASGSGSFGVGQWHHIALRFQGDTITAMLDDTPLATIQDDSHTTGQVGFAAGGWQRVEFDNLQVTPTGPAPRFVPHAGMTVSATSAHDANDFGDSFGAARAIDDRPESYWRSEYAPATPLPQSITLDLHQTVPVHALTYRPPLATTGSGTILGYRVALSTDGQHFDQVASGTWPATIATKVANWPQSHQARFVRLTAVSATGTPATASAAELNVSTTPIIQAAKLTLNDVTPSPVFLTRPGDSAQVTAHVSNPGSTPATGVSTTLQAPTGWTVSPTTTEASTLMPGDTGAWGWQLNAPSTAAPGLYDATITVSYTAKGQRVTFSRDLPVRLGVVAHSGMTATTDSTQGDYQGWCCFPSMAIDDDPGTVWHTSWSPITPLPHQITLDLGSSYEVSGLRYLPRQDNNHNGVITSYTVSVSEDGTNFTQVVAGNWADNFTTKSADFDVHTARYVRLTALAAGGGYASAAEINILGTPS
jgi:hypothetical protein